MQKSCINVFVLEILWVIKIMSIVKEILNKYGDVVYEEHDDGYLEENEYNCNGKLIKSTCHYSNGLIEVEQFANDARLHDRNE